MKIKNLAKILAAGCLVGALLTGCNSSNNNNDNNSTTTPTTEQQSGDTITVTDVRGEVEIPANPTRIVDISGTSDILYLLGYNVIGTANSDAYDYTKFPSYLEAELQGAEILGYFYQDTMDIEAVIALEPDLIIMSTVQEKMYNQLSVVAPTVMIELAQIEWRDDLTNVASIFGKEAIVTEWLADYEEQAAQTGEAIKAAVGADKSYAAILASGGFLYVFTETGIGKMFYEDMNLNRPAGMPVQDNVSLPVISYEGLAEIDADYLFFVGTEKDLTDLENNRIFKNLEAVMEGRYLNLPADVYFGIGFSAVGRVKFLDEVFDLVTSMEK